MVQILLPVCLPTNKINIIEYLFGHSRRVFERILKVWCRHKKINKNKIVFDFSTKNVVINHGIERVLMHEMVNDI